MNSVTVRIPTPLRSYTAGADEVTARGTTVGEVLGELSELHQGLGERILDARGELRQFVNVFVGSRNVRALEGLETRTTEGDVLAIIPAVAGGASS